MNVTLTRTTAKELGKALRFMRHARTLTLRDVAIGAELSSQYVQNIEQGERTNVSEDAYQRVAKGMGVPAAVLADLLLKARVQAALEQRGLDAERVAFVWRGVEQRLAESGIDIRTDLAKVVADLIEGRFSTDVQHDFTTPVKKVIHNALAENGSLPHANKQDAVEA